MLREITSNRYIAYTTVVSTQYNNTLHKILQMGCYHTTRMITSINDIENMTLYNYIKYLIQSNSYSYMDASRFPWESPWTIRKPS